MTIISLTLHQQENINPREMTISNMLGASTLRLSVGQKTTMLQFRKSYVVPRASSNNVPSNFRYPPMKKKPKWWWRTLSCLPYLIPLHQTWTYAETAYSLYPFLEYFQYYTYPFFSVINKLPAWFLISYFSVLYAGIVRRQEWPHFFKFHVMMGILLEMAMQVLGTVSRWLPLSLYWGKFGMHFWTAVSLGYLFTVLECIRCALVGMYADVPFFCDAAYMHISYDDDNVQNES